MIAEVTKKSDGSLSYRNLAGANSDGLPLGTIIAIHRTTCPAGFLPCTGVQYDTEQYPALYLLLGTNVTPDLREANLVGIGLSTREAIQNHDVYTLGQFKDDQVQLAPSGITPTSETVRNALGVVYSDALSSSPESYPVRTGTVTHGKNYGVNYVIKAHTGLVESSDLSLYDEIVAYIDEHYAHDDLINLYNGALIKYDSSTQTYVPVTAPTVNNSVLTATVDSSNLWTKDNVTYYNADMTEAEAPESEAAQSVVVGYTDSSNITVTNQTTGSIWAAGTYYWDNTGEKADPLRGRMTKSYTVSNTAKVLGDHIYDTTDGTNYYQVIALNSQKAILSDELPSATVIAELADIEAGDLDYQEWTTYEYGTVTGYTTTGLVTTPTTTAIDTTTVQAVYCKTYYGTDYDYEWKESSASTGIAFIGTEEEYKTAKLIPEGQSGHIPSGAMIIITDSVDNVYGEDA